MEWSRPTEAAGSTAAEELDHCALQEEEEEDGEDDEEEEEEEGSCLSELTPSSAEDWRQREGFQTPSRSHDIPSLTPSPPHLWGTQNDVWEKNKIIIKLSFEMNKAFF